ncbi:cupin domain-containing protein [Nitrogeniibacter mangrovi]
MPHSPALDAAKIHWRPLEGFSGFTYSVLAVDAERGTTDFVVRYEADSRIFLHRHRADTLTVVMAGEHRIYAPDGRLEDARPAGAFAFTPADADPHTEGGGAAGAVVFYSTRGGADGVIFDIMDEAGQVVGALGLADVAGLFELQGGKPGA